MGCQAMFFAFDFLADEMLCNSSLRSNSRQFLILWVGRHFHDSGTISTGASSHFCLLLQWHLALFASMTCKLHFTLAVLNSGWCFFSCMGTRLLADQCFA